MSVGQRIPIRPGEKAWDLGFKSKQRVDTKDAAFYLSALDAYRLNLPGLNEYCCQFGQWVGGDLQNPEKWLRYYWSEAFPKTLADYPAVDLNSQGVVRVINNNSSQSGNESAVGVEQSGRCYFALYRSTLEGEGLRLNCGHPTNAQVVSDLMGAAETFDSATLQGIGIKCPCGVGTPVMVLLGCLNRTLMPDFDAMVVQQETSCEEIRQSSGTQLPCGCVLSDEDAVNQSQQLLERCVCFQHGARIPPAEWYLIQALQGTSFGNNSPRMCLNPQHEYREVRKPLHGYCYLCDPCIQLLHSSCQQGQSTNCPICCKSMSISDFPEYSAPAPCPNQCGREGEMELVQCKHKFCSKCASLMYRSQATACPCGTPLDVNDYSLLWACEEAKVAFSTPTNPPPTCRNHGERLDVPGKCRTESQDHKYCYPCDECLLNAVKTMQKCPICYKPYSPTDKQLVYQHSTNYHRAGNNP